MLVTSEPSISLFSSRQDTSWFSIIFTVVAIHLGILGFTIYQPATPPKQKGRPKVIVQTVQITAPRQSKGGLIAEAVPLVSPPPPTSKTEVKSQPKPPAPKPAKAEEKKKETPKPAPVKKATAPAAQKAAVPVSSAKSETAKAKPADEGAKKKQQEKVAAEEKAEKAKQEKIERERQEKAAQVEREKQEKLTLAQGFLNKSNQSRDKLKSTPTPTSLDKVAVPKAIVSLQIDALPLLESGDSGNWGVQEINYRDQVGAHLKLGLKLPEFGAVTIRLTLNNAGKVVKVETTKSESAKNKAYIEKSIPLLSFPPFGQQFKGEAQYTFVFILKNNA